VSVSLEHLGEASPREITQLLDLCNISRYSVMLHDYGLICPRINLIDYQGKYCRVQSSDVCEFCISKAGPTESAIEMYSKIESTSQLREGSYNLLKNAFKISAPSMSARLGYKNLFRDLNIKVLPHHREIKFHQRIPNSRHSKTVAILGAISYAKGLALYKELADFMEKFAPEFRFVFIGYTENNKIFQNNKNVVITGKYSKENLKSLIEKYDPVISLHLNIWPETFSYTLSEALRNGLYPFYTELGAVADRLAPMGIGRKYKIDENILNMAKDIVGFYRDLVELEG